MIRKTLRLLAAMVMVGGILLVADVVITLVWQEPVTAFQAQRAQGELKDELEAQANVVSKSSESSQLSEAPKQDAKAPQPHVPAKAPRGQAIGRIKIPAIDVSAYVVQGTDTESLKKGPGHYPGTPFPGAPGTSAIAGHRTTYGAPFNRVNELRPHNVITLNMTYGKLTYRVEKVVIVDDQDTSVLKPVGHSRLMLSACHPLYSAAQRIIVFARLVKFEPPSK